MTQEGINERKNDKATIDTLLKEVVILKKDRNRLYSIADNVQIDLMFREFLKDCLAGKVEGTKNER